MFHIKNIKITDFKNLNAISSEFPESGMLMLFGKNGAGKSAYMTATQVLFKGKSLLGKYRTDFIKEGKNKATIKGTIINQETGERIEITRVITQDNKLKTKFKSSMGRQLNETVIKSLISDKAFDPQKLKDASGKEMAQILQELAGLDFSELDEKYAEVYDERRMIGREKKQLEGALSEFMDIEPVEAVEVSELYQEKEKIEKYNREIDNQIYEKESVEEELDDIKVEIKNLTKQLKDLKEKKKEFTASLKAYTDKPIPEKKSVDKIVNQIEEAGSINERAKMYQEYQEKEKAFEESEQKYEECTQQLEDLQHEKEELVQESNLPLKDLSFDPDKGALYKGRAFNTFSNGERLLIAIKLAQAYQPELRLIYIQDASILDDTNLKMLKKIKEDFQLIVEVPREDEGTIKDFILLEDGEIIKKG